MSKLTLKQNLPSNYNSDGSSYLSISYTGKRCSHPNHSNRGFKIEFSGNFINTKETYTNTKENCDTSTCKGLFQFKVRFNDNYSGCGLESSKLKLRITSPYIGVRTFFIDEILKSGGDNVLIREIPFDRTCGDSLLLDLSADVEFFTDYPNNILRKVEDKLDFLDYKIVCSNCGMIDSGKNSDEGKLGEEPREFQDRRLNLLSDDGIILYPNPANKEFTLIFSSKKPTLKNISISNMMGQKVYQKNNISVVGKTQLNVDVTNFKEDIYFIMITDKEGTITKQDKLVVKR